MSETGLAIARLKELTDRLTTMDERVEARHKILRIEECLVALAGNADRSAPIAMRLPCEKCGTLHIDVGKFATHPHHTHTCQNKSCGLTWRPAKEHTVGVRFIPGFENDPLLPVPPLPYSDTAPAVGFWGELRGSISQPRPLVERSTWQYRDAWQGTVTKIFDRVVERKERIIVCGPTGIAPYEWTEQAFRTAFTWVSDP